MAIITLLTDFGVDDAYVGMMKGVILSVNPTLTIVDITHHVDPQDLIQAAYIIKSSFGYFPEGTVHLIVVDPGVGSVRAIIALEMTGHFFLAPDNGVLTLLMDEGDVGSIYQVDNSMYFMKSVSRTFHGRDIFAPVGAHISRGVDIKKLGIPIDQKDLASLDIRKPFASDKGELIGTIISVDRFGNLITNIDFGRIETFCETDSEKTLQVLIGGEKINGLSRHYGEVAPMRPLAIIGSLGYLEVAINCGNAHRHFMVEKGDTVRVAKS